MARPQLILVLPYLVVGAFSQPAAHITFMGTFYPSYSCIDLSQVGVGENDGIQCHTDLSTCCTELQGADRGDWYPPYSSSSLPFYSEAAYIYQERGDRRVDLYRRDLDSAGDAGEGIYKCAIETLIYNPDHSWDVSDRAMVFVELKNGGCDITVDPTITLSQDSDFSDESTRFQLTCISNGSPTATWTRDSSYVSEGSTTTVSTSGSTIQFIHTLTVTEILGGLYTCTAGGGTPPTNSASFYIKVASTPADLKSVQVGLTDIRLTWAPPSPLGDTTYYQISYTTPNTQSSITVYETVGLTNSTILQLETGENYTLELAGGSEHFSSKSITTHIYVAPVGTPETFRVKAAQREVEFSWSPPKVSAPISGYTLYCYPSPDSFPLTFPSPGSYSVTAFSPATQYRCSLIANYNSSVSGVPTNVDFITLPDHRSFEVNLAGFINCFEWLALSPSPYDDKLQDIRDQIVKEVADSCECDFTSSNIDRQTLNCSSGSSNSLSYTARLTSTFADVDSAELADFMSSWISSGPTITVEGVLFRVVEDQCIGFVSTVSSNVCPNHRGSTVEDSNKTALVAGVPAAVVGAIVLIGVLAIAVCVIISRRRVQRTGSAELPQQQQQQRQQQQRQPPVPQLISNPRRQEPLLPLREDED